MIRDLGWLTAVLPLAGFASYLRGTLRGTTRPSRVSWALWAIAPMIAFAAEVTEGTSLRLSLLTFVLGLGPALILAASFASPRAYWRLGRFDWACGAVACAALAAWAVTRRGDVAIALAIAADLCAALPTIAKSWSHPEFESAGTYLASGAGAGITLLTIQHWSFANAGFAAYVLALCSVIVAFIALRPLLSRRGPTARTSPTAPWRGQPRRSWPPALALALHRLLITLQAAETAEVAPATQQRGHMQQLTPPGSTLRRRVNRPQPSRPSQAALPLPPGAAAPSPGPSPTGTGHSPTPWPSPARFPSPHPSSASPTKSATPSPSPSPIPSPTETYPSPTPTASSHRPAPASTGT